MLLIDVWPRFGIADEAGSYGVHFDIFPLVVVAFFFPEAVIEEVSLESDRVVVPQKPLPLLHGTTHIAPERKIHQGMKVVRHQEHDAHGPFPKCFIALNAAEDGGSLLDMAKGVCTSLNTAKGQKIGRIPLGKRRDPMVEVLT